jgi:hypothetical protein
MAIMLNFTGRRMTAAETEIVKWEPFACALYEAIRREQMKFGAGDMIMVEVLQSLMDGFLADLEGEHGGGDDAA